MNVDYRLPCNHMGSRSALFPSRLVSRLLPAVEPNITREMRLRREAKSDRHKLLHFPKNPYCRICKSVKPQAKPARRRGPDNVDEAVHFGDQLLTDHTVIINAEGHSEAGDKAAILIVDEATGFKDFVPVPSKSGDDSIVALGVRRGGICY